MASIQKNRGDKSHRVTVALDLGFTVTNKRFIPLVDQFWGLYGKRYSDCRFDVWTGLHSKYEIWFCHQVVVKDILLSSIRLAIRFLISVLLRKTKFKNFHLKQGPLIRASEDTSYSSDCLRICTVNTKGFVSAHGLCCRSIRTQSGNRLISLDYHCLTDFCFSVYTVGHQRKIYAAESENRRKRLDDIQTRIKDNQIRIRKFLVQ